jgi:hypothetical protein
MHNIETIPVKALQLKNILQSNCSLRAIMISCSMRYVTYQWFIFSPIRKGWIGTCERFTVDLNYLTDT